MSIILVHNDISLQHIVLGVILSTLSIVGTVGNILILVVYTKSRESQISRIFIKLLAVMDLVVCLLIMPYTVVLNFAGNYSNLVCKLIEFIRHFVVVTSGMTLIGVAAERYVAICHPLKTRQECFWSRLLLAIVCTAAVAAFPATLFFSVNKTTVEGTVYIESCTFDSNLQNIVWHNVFNAVLTSLFLIVVVSIITMYILIYIAVRKSNKLFRVVKPIGVVPRAKTDSQNYPPHTQNYPHQEISLRDFTSAGHSEITGSIQEPPSDRICRIPNSNVQSQGHLQRRHKELKTILMLFASFMIFAVTWIPFFVNIMDKESHIIRYTFFINNVTNIFVYGIFSKNTRTQIRSLFCRKNVAFG